jgi:hypothetical protein
MKKDTGLTIKTNGLAGVIMPDNSDEKGAIFYRNRATKEFLIRNLAIKPFPPTIVTEHWIDIDWKIKNSFKTLLGYKLQKAGVLLEEPGRHGLPQTSLSVWSF